MLRRLFLNVYCTEYLLFAILPYTFHFSIIYAGWDFEVYILKNLDGARLGKANI